jgi:hypothetical protein
MQKVYVLQVQGWGDNENEFYVTGVYDSKDAVETAQRNLISEADADELETVTQIEVFELNA